MNEWKIQRLEKHKANAVTDFLIFLSESRLCFQKYIQFFFPLSSLILRIWVMKKITVTIYIKTGPKEKEKQRRKQEHPGYLVYFLGERSTEKITTAKKKLIKIKPPQINTLIN